METNTAENQQTAIPQPEEEQTQAGQQVQTEEGAQAGEAAEVLDGAEELIKELDDGKETMQADQTAKASAEDGQKNKIKFDIYDHSEIFKNEIEPLIEQIAKKCDELEIPYVIGMVPVGRGEEGFTQFSRTNNHCVERSAHKMVAATAALNEDVATAVFVGQQLIGGLRADDLDQPNTLDLLLIHSDAHDKFCPKHGSNRRNRGRGGARLYSGTIPGGLDLLRDVLKEVFGEEDDRLNKATRSGADAGGQATADAGGVAGADATGNQAASA
jgi:hypothetical protein